MGNNRIMLGKWGEEKAKEYLIKKGYILIEQNWRTKHGEIDLIMLNKDTLVFIEVRTKSIAQFGYSYESITHKKIYKIKKMASIYLQQKNWWDKEIRFDLIALDKTNVNGHFELRHIENIIT